MGTCLLPQTNKQTKKASLKQQNSSEARFAMHQLKLLDWTPMNDNTSDSG